MMSIYKTSIAPLLGNTHHSILLLRYCFPSFDRQKNVHVQMKHYYTIMCYKQIQ